MIDLTQYIWIMWLIFILVCVIIELLTLEFTFLMVAFGSLAGFAGSLLGWQWWVQILVAAAVSVALLLTIRPLLLRVMNRGADLTPSNIAALSGMSGRCVSPVDVDGGLVHLANGETWTARLSPASSPVPLEIGDSVRVSRVDGATIDVVPATSASPQITPDPARGADPGASSQLPPRTDPDMPPGK